MTTRPGRVHAGVLLGLIVLIALAVRLWGITFGLPFVHARPDEVLIISTVLRFFTGDLNPRFFDYPTLYLYMLGAAFAVFYVWGRTTGRFAHAEHFVNGPHDLWQVPFVIGRTLTAAFGTLTVLVIYRLGTAAADRRTGLLAAFFLSLAFLHVRDSRYATTDVPLTFFLVLAVLALVRLHEGRRLSHAVVAAIAAGLATSIKYNAVLLAAPMIAVDLLHARRAGSWRAGLRSSYLPLMAGVAAATVFATSPYLLLEYERALRDIAALQESMGMGMTPPEVLGRGWTYHARVSLPHGLGLPLFGASLLGIVLMSVRRPDLALVLGAFPLTYYVVAGAGFNVFVRYMVPIVPFLCVFAAFLVGQAATWIGRNSRIPAPAAVVGLAVLVIAPSASSTVQFNRILAREDSRMVAARWLHEHVPQGSTIFMSGNPYGHPPLERDREAKYRGYRYDWSADRFREGGRLTDEWPEWIVVQRSPLPYSHIPERVVAALPNAYHLVHIVRAYDPAAPGNVYDIQDAFYVPYAGFRGVRLPGPNLEIYRRRETR